MTKHTALTIATILNVILFAAVAIANAFFKNYPVALMGGAAFLWALTAYVLRNAVSKYQDEIPAINKEFTRIKQELEVVRTNPPATLEQLNRRLDTRPGAKWIVLDHETYQEFYKHPSFQEQVVHSKGLIQYRGVPVYTHDASGWYVQ